MPVSGSEDTSHWFASKQIVSAGTGYRWYPVNIQGLLALCIILAGFTASVSLAFIPLSMPYLMTGAMIFILTQIFCAYVLFWKTRCLDPLP